MQRAEHHDRSYRGAGKFRRDIFGDGGKPEHVYVQHLSIGSRPFEILTSVVAQTEFQALACDRLLSAPEPDINEIREALQEIASGRAGRAARPTRSSG